VSCCVGFAAAKEAIAQVVAQYHQDDYKIFVANRTANGGINYKVTVGIVVQPDVDKNTELFEALLRLQAQSKLCLKVLHSNIDLRDQARLMDLFLIEIEAEAIQ